MPFATPHMLFIDWSAPVAFPHRKKKINKEERVAENKNVRPM